jgi:hypothetical protein
MMTRNGVSIFPCIVASVLIGHASADDNTERAVKDGAWITESFAKKRYERLMQQAEGDGRRCIAANTFEDEMREALRAFGNAVNFVELGPDKPITVEISETYYHPLGRTITFDRFDLVINRRSASKMYISMTKTGEGLRVEPKIALELNDGSIICVRNISAIVSYDTSAP